ncbi:hypothetical protein DFH07DRAFT_945262 [Mycena maculata]|uniref:FAD-binding domain-containing protein n=1 Tax=Mycena maculata TaxID=230809 RepID=A0AAD7HYG8_9AGAR|nr:hypothetical protein DFH07DRAFT_945262 [Mycena maculata]
MATSKAGLNFIVVGASVAGLTSAIGLKAAGHRVLVLEKDSQLGGPGLVPSGCPRVSPSGCKILFDWGLEAETRARSVLSEGFAVYKYDNGGKSPRREFIGVNLWNQELLAEARGGFLQLRNQDLLQILYDAAVKEDSNPLVTVIFGAEVVGVDCDTCTVTLQSGQIHRADAIIGADGAGGVVRRTLMLEEGVAPETHDKPTGLAMYGCASPNSTTRVVSSIERCFPSASIPRKLLEENGDFATFYEYPEHTITMGSNRGVIAYCSGKEKDIMMWVYTPDSSQDGTWTDVAEKKFVDVLGPCAEEIEKLAALAGPATCLQIRDHYNLQSWASRSGRVLVLGEGAHPLPLTGLHKPASFHTYSIALEDGAFIGKIFSRTRNRDRVPEFFHAFQEHRHVTPPTNAFFEPRSSRIRVLEKEYISLITLPDGEMAAARDAAMRANHADGRSVMDNDLEQMRDGMIWVFTYDPADDADEWCVYILSTAAMKLMGSDGRIGGYNGAASVPQASATISINDRSSFPRSTGRREYYQQYVTIEDGPTHHMQTIARESKNLN